MKLLLLILIPRSLHRLPNSSGLCTAMCKRNRLMCTEGKVEGEEKKEIKENIWQGDLQLWRNVSTAALAEAAAVSVLNVRSISAGRVAGRWEKGDASKWLYDSCYQV